MFLTSPSTTPTAAVTAFDNAATLWSNVLQGTRINSATVGSGVSFNNPFQCGLAYDTAIPAGSINQLYIAAEIKPIDGVGGTLGSAGYCGAFLTNTDTGVLMPVIGRMFFDTDDLENMAANGHLEHVILHEMAHVSLKNIGSPNISNVLSSINCLKKLAKVMCCSLVLSYQ